MRVTLIRRYRFQASHSYGRPDWSALRNRETFGAQVEPHSHDWMLEVSVSGVPDPETGFVIDLGLLDRVVEDRVLSLLSAGEINRSVPEVEMGTIQPSTEALALWAWKRLHQSLPSTAALVRVRLAESDDLISEVRGPNTPEEDTV